VFNSTVPMEFQAVGRGRNCAALVVWTQSRAP
jgi:hypothetical protein